MQQLGRITPEVIKQCFSAERFYPMFLEGSFGKHTGNGWFAWNGLCPFHNDRHAGSFFIHKPSGAYQCFACGAKGGDIIDFYRKRCATSFPETLNILGGHCHA